MQWVDENYRERNREKIKDFTLDALYEVVEKRLVLFFEGSHLSIATIVQFIYFWCRDMQREASAWNTSQL